MPNTTPPRRESVFSDPTKHRKMVVQIVVFSLLSIAAVLLFGFIFSLFYLKSLPTSVLDDPETFQAPRIQDFVADRYQTSTPQPATIPVLSNTVTPYIRPTFQNTYALVPDWPLQGFASLKQNLNSIDVVLPDWFRLDLQSGALVTRLPVRQKVISEYLAQNKTTQKILPVISGFNGVEPGVLQNLNSDGWLASSFAEAVVKNGYDGLCFNLLWVPAASIPEVLDLLHDVSASLDQSCAIVSLSSTDWPLQDLADVTDAIVFIGFDAPDRNSRAGPVTVHNDFALRSAEVLAQIDPQKAVFALGNVGFDWTSGIPLPSQLHFSEIARLAGLHEAEIRFSTAALNSSITFVDAQGTRHQIWFADAVTAYNQIITLKNQPVEGFAIWPIGGEDPALWNLLDPPPPSPTIEELLRFVAVSDYVGYEGEGEFLTAFGTPAPGIRTLVADPDSGLIINQAYTQLPATITVARWGKGGRNQIALTFDDGPDPVFTPQILDILREKDVPAAFFVVGENALANTDIVRRTVDEGHEIGVHTFLHPNIDLISNERLTVEVSATQRLLAAITGKNTVLFRPPYGEDTEPQTGTEAATLLQLSRDGYLTVGIRIDPRDWFNPGVEAIIERVRAGALLGEGNIMLLHDAGSDRTQTVTALPLIIDMLRAEGFEFVSLGTLIGADMFDLMPPAKETYMAVDPIFFNVGTYLQQLLVIIFALALSLGILRSVLVVFAALLRQRRNLRDGPHFPVSLIVPAYNEEMVVLRTIESALNSDYDDLMVIVVDDGSTDKTYQLVRDAYGDNPRVTLITQENQGKSVALNYGYSIAKTDIIVAVDADTLIDPDAVRLLVRHFENPKIGAVAGNTKVGNRMNLLTRLQAVEYITSQNLDRRAFEIFNAILVVPGSIGAWRKSVVQEVGGYTLDTLAEDADLTVSIIRGGYRIIYEDKAFAMTEAPETLSQLSRQRLRWTLGILQVGWKHKSAVLEGKGIGLVALPNILLFGTILPLIAPIADFVFFAAVFRLVRDFIHHPTMVPGIEDPTVLLIYIAYLLSDVILSTFAFFLEPKEDKRLIFWVIFQRFFYRQMLYIAVFRSVSRALTGRLSGWQKVVRFADVEMPTGQQSRSTQRRVDLQKVPR